MDGHVTLPYLQQEQVGLTITELSQDSKEMFEYIKGYSPVQNVKSWYTISSDYGYHRRSR
jgi:protease II